MKAAKKRVFRRRRASTSRRRVCNPYTIEQLMQGHDPNAPVPSDILLFLNMRPVGMEII